MRSVLETVFSVANKASFPLLIWIMYEHSNDVWCIDVILNAKQGFGYSVLLSVAV